MSADVTEVFKVDIDVHEPAGAHVETSAHAIERDAKDTRRANASENVPMKALPVP